MAPQAFMSRSRGAVGGYILCFGYVALVTSVWGQARTPALDNGSMDLFTPSEKPGDPTSAPDIRSRVLESPEFSHSPNLLVSDRGSDGADRYRTNSGIIEPSQDIYGGETTTTADTVMIEESFSESLDVYQRGDKTSDVGYLGSSIMDKFHSGIPMDISMEEQQTEQPTLSRSTVSEEVIRLDSSVIVHQMSPSQVLHHSRTVWSNSYQTDQPIQAGSKTQLSDFANPVSDEINIMPLTSVPGPTSSFVRVMPTTTAMFDELQATKFTRILPTSAQLDIPDHSDVFNQSRSAEIFEASVPTSSHIDVPFYADFSNHSGFSERLAASVLPSLRDVSSHVQMTSVMNYPSETMRSTSETMWSTSNTMWSSSGTMWSTPETRWSTSETMWSTFTSADSTTVHSSSEMNFMSFSESSYLILNQSASTDSLIVGSSSQFLSNDSWILPSTSQLTASNYVNTISPVFPDKRSQNVSEWLSSSSILMPSLPIIMSTSDQFNMTSVTFYPTQYVSSSIPVITVTSPYSEMNHTHDPLYTAMLSSEEVFSFSPLSSSSSVFNHSISMPSLAYSSVSYIESLIHSTETVSYSVPSYITVKHSTSMLNFSSIYSSTREPREYQTSLPVDADTTRISSLSDWYGSTPSVSHYPVPSVIAPEEMSSPDLMHISTSESPSETFYPILATVPLFDYSSEILEESDVLGETVYSVSPTFEPPHMFSTPVQEATTSLAAIPTSSAAPPVRTTASLPTVEYINQKFLLTFNGDCQPLVGHLDRVQKFQSQVKRVIVVSLGLDEGAVYMDRLVCGSVKSSVIIYNATQNYSTEISDLVSSGDFLIQMKFGDSNLTYRAYKVEEVSLEDSVEGSGEQKGDDGLDTKDIVLIILACCICAVLIIIGVVVCAKQMYRKKYAQSFNLMDTPHVNLKMEDFTLTRIPRPRASYGEGGVQVQSYYQSNGNAMVRPVPPPRQNFTRHSQQNSQSSDFDSTFDHSVDISDVRIDENKTSSFVHNSRPFTYTPNGNDLASKDNGGYVSRTRSIDSESTVHDRSTENLVPGMNGSRLQGSVNPIYSGDDTEATASIASDPPPYTDDHPVSK